MRCRMSVVIPFFNAERWLADAIECALGQDATAEIIAVDDGSTDSSMVVAQRYSPRVRCLSRPNGGVGAARNTGLAAATGDYVVFLDADDVFEGPFLSGVADTARGGADIIISRSGTRRGTHTRLHPRNWEDRSHSEIALDVAEGRTVVVHAQAFRSEFLRRAGGFREVQYEDTELLLRLLLGGASLGFNQAGLALWCLRDNHDGLSSDRTEPALRSALEWHRDHSFILPLAADPRLTLAYGRRCYSLAVMAFEGGYRYLGRDALSLAHVFGFHRDRTGSRLHRIATGLLGLERKVALARSWRGIRARFGFRKALR